MTVQTLTLSDFLLARIAEDQEWASAAIDFGNDRWAPDDLGRWRLGGELQPMTHAEAVHIARHDPARVLAECDTKRRIVKMAETSLERLMITAPVWRLVLKNLALPYADHPGYQREWRP